MRTDLNAHYRALGLNPGADPAQIKRAYRQLIRQWHPDLFKPGSPMQTTAEDITKEINEAYEQLFRKGLHRKFRRAPGQRPETEDMGERSPREDPVRKAQPRGPSKERRRRRAASAPGSAGAAQRKSPAWTRKWPRAFLGAHWGKAAVGALLIAGGAAFYPVAQEILATLRPRPAARVTRDLVRAPGATRAARPSAVGSGAPAMGDAVPLNGSPSSPVTAQPLAREARGVLPEFMGDGSPQRHGNAEALLTRAELLLDLFETGDTKARVVAIQGVPDEVGDTVYRYGSSLVYFRDGRVRDWSDGVPRLRVRAWPSLDLPTLDRFSLGSTRGDVVRAQGQPSGLSLLAYSYGSSAIYFEGDRVSGWNEGDVGLRTLSLPALPYFDLDQSAYR